MISRFAVSGRQRWLAVFLGWTLSFLVSSLIPPQALASSSHISGRVTDAATDLPLPGITIEFYDQHGVFVANTTTNGNGEYSSPELYAADYYVRTSTGVDYQNELYGGAPCGYACSPSNQSNHTPVFDGSIVPLIAGATKTGIDFKLKPGGSISGKITDAETNAPLANKTVTIYDSIGNIIDIATSNVNGIYASNKILPNGAYFLFITDWDIPGYLSQGYNKEGCPIWCSYNITDSSSISVILGQQTGDINFKLTRGGEISGTITVKNSGVPQSNINIQITDADTLREAEQAWTDNDGVFHAHHLPAGSYYVSVYNRNGDTILYNGITCPSNTFCDLTQGNPISVKTGTATENIDFALDDNINANSPGYVTGKLIDSTTGDPVSDATVTFISVSGSSNYFGQAWVDPEGHYTSFPLPPGTYYAYTGNWSGYIDEYLGGKLKPHNWGRPADSTLITVAAGQTTTGVDFALAKGGQITGTITDSSTGRPLPEISVTVIDDTGNPIGWGWTDTNGAFTAPGFGLSSGNYHVLANPSHIYLPQAYGATPCATAACTNNLGTPIQIAAKGTNPDINFSLARGGIITGKIKLKDTPPGEILYKWNSYPNYNNVYILRQDGVVTSDFVEAVTVDTFGRYYSHSPLVNGTYYAEARNFDQYLGKRYDNVACTPHCKPNTGKPIIIAANTANNHIDFNLDTKGSVISGKITSQTNGIGIQGQVDILDTDGNFITSAISGGDGQYITTALPLGTYYLMATSGGQNPAAWLPIAELYQNRPYAGSGGYQSGTPVTITQIGAVSDINFELDEGFSIQGLVISEATAHPLSDSRIFVFDHTGLLVAKTQSSGSLYMTGHYSTPALPPGKYYVIAERDAYQAEAYGNIPVTATACVDDIHCRIDPANLKDATQITITNTSVNNINFVLAPGTSKESPVKGAVDSNGDGGGGAIVLETLALAILTRRLRITHSA